MFTGDTLLIRGTGRTDFQNGDPRAQYELLFNKLLKLPDETHGLSRPTTTKATRSRPSARRRLFNPRLQVKSIDEYVDADEQSETAQPEDDGRGGAGQHAGRPRTRTRSRRRGWALSAAEAIALRGRPRRRPRRPAREAASAKSTASSRARCTRPTRTLQEHICAGGMLHELAAATGKRIVFYCAFGERSAMAVQAAQDAGLDDRLPHPGRHRRLEEGRRPAGALTECAPGAARCSWRHVR